MPGGERGAASRFRLDDGLLERSLRVGWMALQDDRGSGQSISALISKTKPFCFVFRPKPDPLSG